MTHDDHVRLIKQGIGKAGGQWADLGSGTGAFTLALRDIVGPAGTIYSVDKHQPSLDSQKRRMDREFPLSRITYVAADFTEPLQLPLVDGIIMANSLHYVSHQSAFLKSIARYLKPGGRLVFVEYNAEHGNMWVPHPVSFSNLTTLMSESGYSEPELLDRIPSDFLHEIYSAVSFKQPK